MLGGSAATIKEECCISHPRFSSLGQEKILLGVGVVKPEPVGGKSVIPESLAGKGGSGDSEKGFRG